MTTTELTMDLEAHFVNPNIRREQEETLYDRVAQRLDWWRLSREPEKKYGIEKLKALEATEFTGTANQTICWVALYFGEDM